MFSRHVLSLYSKTIEYGRQGRTKYLSSKTLQLYLLSNTFFLCFLKPG